MSNVTFADVERLRVFPDGDCWCVTLDNFENLQESPAVFFGPNSWQGKVLTEWRHVPRPLVHLAVVNLLSIARELLLEYMRGGYVRRK